MDTKIEQTNQLVRAYIVCILVTGFVLAFLSGLWRNDPYVSTEAYVGILMAAFVWWFKSRDEDKTQKTVAEAVKVAIEAPLTNGKDKDHVS